MRRTSFTAGWATHSWVSGRPRLGSGETQDGRGAHTGPVAKRPTALVLSRQELPPIDRTRFASATGLHRGAYVLADASEGEPELILLATGSEVWLALAAQEELERRQEIPTRVVSMPCWELFEAQDQSYREEATHLGIPCEKGQGVVLLGIVESKPLLKMLSSKGQLSQPEQGDP